MTYISYLMIFQHFWKILVPGNIYQILLNCGELYTKQNTVSFDLGTLNNKCRLCWNTCVCVNVLGLPHAVYHTPWCHACWDSAWACHTWAAHLPAEVRTRSVSLGSTWVKVKYKQRLMGNSQVSLPHKHNSWPHDFSREGPKSNPWIH
jgi:hypothetical protein